MAGTFGDNLSRLMKEKHLAARELARQVGVPHKTFLEWLAPGHRMPRNPEHLKRLSQVLGCSVHALLYGEEDPTGLLGAVLEKTEIHTGLYEITIKKVKSK